MPASKVNIEWTVLMLLNKNTDNRNSARFAVKFPLTKCELLGFAGLSTIILYKHPLLAAKILTSCRPPQLVYFYLGTFNTCPQPHCSRQIRDGRGLNLPYLLRRRFRFPSGRRMVVWSPFACSLCEAEVIADSFDAKSARSRRNGARHTRFE